MALMPLCRLMCGRSLTSGMRNMRRDPSEDQRPSAHQAAKPQSEKRTLKLTRNVIALVASAFLLWQTHSGSALSQNSSELIDGFAAEGTRVQRRLEEDFRRVPAHGSAREHLRRLTAEPHVAGTKEDYATAIYVRDQIDRKS